jgi:hypothetical protein
MISASLIVDLRRAAKLTSDDQQDLVGESTLLKIFDESANGFIYGRAK